MGPPEKLGLTNHYPWHSDSHSATQQTDATMDDPGPWQTRRVCLSNSHMDDWRLPSTIFEQLNSEAGIGFKSISEDLLGGVIWRENITRWAKLPGHHNTPAMSAVIALMMLVRRPDEVTPAGRGWQVRGLEMPYAQVRPKVLTILYRHGVSCAGESCCELGKSRDA